MGHSGPFKPLNSTGMNILQLMGLTRTYFTASLNVLIYLN